MHASDFSDGRVVAPFGVMGSGVDRFTNLPAWQACETYKNAVYRLCEEILSKDWRRRNQLEEAVRGPGAHIAEGFGRFNPPDSARFVVMARASLMESQNHLIDLVDRRYIAEERRAALDRLAVVALEEVTGLLEYLQSPEALRNARRARERRLATRDQRRTARRPRATDSECDAYAEPRTLSPVPRTLNPEPRTLNPEPRTLTPEPRTWNPEPRTRNPEPRTRNPEPRTRIPEPRTRNPEPRTRNPEPRNANPERHTSYPEPGTEPEHEPGTGNAEE